MQAYRKVSGAKYFLFAPISEETAVAICRNFGDFGFGEHTDQCNALYLGEIIDEIALGHVHRLLRWLGLYLLIAFSTVGMSCLEEYWGSKLNYKVETEIKQQLLKKALYLRCKELDALDTGVLVSRIVSDASEVITFVFEVITSAVTIVVNIAAALFFSFRISVPLSAVSLGFIPLSIFSNIMFKRAYRVLSKLQKNMEMRFPLSTLIRWAIFQKSRRIA